MKPEELERKLSGDAIERMTPEQAAAYVNATCMVTLSEMLSMHWQNEQFKLDTQLRLAAGMDVAMPIKLPNDPQLFMDRAARHCVMHPVVLALYERARGKGK